MISDTAVVHIVNSRRNNEVFLNACKQGGGSPLQQIMNGTSAILRRGEIEKPVTILTLAPGDCGSDQSFNFLDVSPDIARMFRLRDRILYRLTFNVETSELSIRLINPVSKVPFGFENQSVRRNDVILFGGFTSDALNLPEPGTIITVRRAGTARKLILRFAEGETAFSDGFVTSPETARRFGLTLGMRYTLRYSQIARVLEIFSGK